MQDFASEFTAAFGRILSLEFGFSSFFYGFGDGGLMLADGVAQLNDGWGHESTLIPISEQILPIPAIPFNFRS